MQGPALYAYNDAMFAKEDWKGILLLSDSVKEKDPMKVGRFGLGFKSVFHMTGMSEFAARSLQMLKFHRFHVDELGEEFSFRPSTAKGHTRKRRSRF